jgi:type IV secretory pathway VirB2 component (pilin)
MTDRVTANTERALAAIAALTTATTDNERLAAAQALESAACQLRRALKTRTAERVTS